MPFKATRLKITKKQRSQLAAIARKQTAPAAEVMRAKIVLGLVEKKPYRALGSELGISSATIARWRNRFEEDGVAGLVSIHPGKAPTKLTAATRARVLAKTQQAPPDGSTHWSCRKMAKELNLSKTLVHRIWRESDLQPHRLDRYMASNDPDFERKAADIIGLYLNPPQHAAVFCVDENQPSRPWIAKIPVCRSRRAGPSATASSIFAMALCPFTPRWTSERVRSSAKPPPVIPAPSSSASFGK